MAAIAAAACGGSDEEPWTAALVEVGAAPMTQSEVEAWGADVAAVSAASISSWDARDMDALRGLYTDDIVHDDRAFGAHLEGIDEVMRMADSLLARDAQFGPSDDFGAGFVGGEGGVMVWHAWDIFGMTEADPLIEVDRLTIADGRISDWQLLYERPELQAPLDRYAEAWASGEAAGLEAIYAPDVARRDTVMGLASDAVGEIVAVAERFSAAHPDSEWELLMPFSNSRTGRSDETTAGGFFAVTDSSGCVVRVAPVVVILDELILDEDVFYDAASLVECGWLAEE